MSYNTTTRKFEGIAAKQENCWCGILFAIPATLAEYFYRQNGEKAGSFTLYCPLGHAFVPAGKSTADKLRDELAREKHRAEQAEARATAEREMRWEANRATEKVERRLRATKAVVTRTKKKIVAGRCPCCSTKFKDLAVHMRTEHPNYDPEKAVAAIEAKG